MASRKAVTVISAPPHSIPVADHAEMVSSTPSSFADIPPVLRLTQENVSVEFDPPVEGLSTEELSNGTLYIVESVLAFISSSSGKGFEVLYPSITIHAVSRAGGRSLVYCQLEESSLSTEAPAIINGGSHPAEEAERPDGDEELVDVVELKIYPTDPAKIDDIFESLSLCASLHPDPNIDRDSLEDDDALDTQADFEPFTGTADEELSEVGRAALAHLESIIVYPHGVQKPAGIDDEDEDEPENSAEPSN